MGWTLARQCAFLRNSAHPSQLPPRHSATHLFHARTRAHACTHTYTHRSLDWGRISTVAASIRGLSALSVLAGEMAKSTQPGLVLMAAAAASQIPGAVAPSSAALASAKKEGVSDMAVDAPTLRKNDVTMAPPPSYSATEAAASSAAAVADSSADSLLLVRNIPASVEQEQVKMLLVAFGAIKEGSFMLRPDTSQGGAAGDEKGLEALFCYEDDAVTEGAMVGLRTIKIGEKELAVERVDGSAVATGAAAGGAAGADGGAPGRTLRLLHMCSAEELRTFKEADWKELEGEVRSECSNYGTVASVKSEQSTGAVFVEFGDAAAANSCKGKMNGRTFDGRTIEATIE